MKNLLKIPRNYSANFCWQNESGPDHEEVVKNIEAKPAGIDTRMFEKNNQAILEAQSTVVHQKEIAEANKLAEQVASGEINTDKVVEVNINTASDSKLAEASNRDLAVAYEANVEDLLGEIEASMKGGSFDSEYMNIG